MSRTNEYTPIILEVGARFIKAGIAGQSQPLSTLVTSVEFPETVHELEIPSFFGLQDSALTSSQYDLLSTNLWLDPNIHSLSLQYTQELHKWINFHRDFESLLHGKLLKMFSSELLVSPRKCKVILLDCNYSVVTKFKIVQILLGKLMVKSVILQPESILSTVASDTENALIFDFGWHGFRIDLIIDLRNVNINTRTEFNSLTGTELHFKFVLKLFEVLEKDVVERLTQRNDFFELIEQFIMTAMYVNERSDSNNSNELNDGFELVDGITIPSRLRYEVIEECFFDNEELLRIVDSVIQKSTVDSRPLLLQNVVITGGVSNVPGFRCRLVEELRHYFKDAKIDSKVCMGSWSGCSLYVSLVLVNQDKSVWKEKELTRDMFNSLSNERGYKLSGFPDTINSLHRHQ